MFSGAGHPLVKAVLKPWGPRAPEGGSLRAKGEPQPCSVAEPRFGTVPMGASGLHPIKAWTSCPVQTEDELFFFSPRG